MWEVPSTGRSTKLLDGDVPGYPVLRGDGCHIRD
jgi:hypothetical protein